MRKRYGTIMSVNHVEGASRLRGDPRGVCVLRNYRLYRLDGVGKIVSAEWLSAADDDAAARQARDGEPQSTVEIWDRHRLVIRIEPNQETEG